MLLANRLRVVHPNIISSRQSAVVLHRDIHDNILLAHVILTTFSINCSRGGYMLLNRYGKVL